MRIPDPYFEKVPQYGNLQMEQILVEYVYPLLSVLKDESDNRYLCLCYDTRGAQQWIITPILNADLVELLQNKLTLSAPFEKSDLQKVHVVRNYENGLETFELLDASEVQEEDLPKKGEFLDSENHEWDEYIERIISSNEYTVKERKNFAIRIEPIFRFCLNGVKERSSQNWKEMGYKYEKRECLICAKS